jgi:hypothetical protein
MDNSGTPALVGSSEGLGAVVAIERRDGSMSMCSWFGETLAVWARFDVEYPQEIPMGLLRSHLVEAIPRERGADRPAAGFWAAICFKAPNVRAEAAPRP